MVGVALIVVTETTVAARYASWTSIGRLHTALMAHLALADFDLALGSKRVISTGGGGCAAVVFQSRSRAGLCGLHACIADGLLAGITVSRLGAAAAS